MSSYDEGGYMRRAQPGTGSPPAVKFDPVDKAAALGWRRDPPPAAFETLNPLGPDPYVVNVVEDMDALVDYQ